MRPASHRPASAASAAPARVSMPVQLRTAVSRNPAITVAVYPNSIIMRVPSAPAVVRPKGDPGFEHTDPGGQQERSGHSRAKKKGPESKRE